MRYVSILICAILLFLVTGCGKKDLVQQTCDTYGSFKAVKGSDVIDSTETDKWYCCNSNLDYEVGNCILFE